MHLQEFKPDFALDILNSSKIEKIVVPAIILDDFTKIVNLLNSSSNKIVPAFGIHPWYDDDLKVSLISELLEKYPLAMIGETGIDGGRNKNIAAQCDKFITQIDLAKKFNRGLIIHAVKAYNELYACKDLLKSIKFVVHGYVKNQELLKLVNNCGGFFGIGPMFLRNKEAKKLWKMLPIDRVLFETDAPYMVSDIDYFEVVEKNFETLSNIVEVDKDVLIKQFNFNAREFIYGRKNF